MQRYWMFKQSLTSCGSRSRRIKSTTRIHNNATVYSSRYVHRCTGRTGNRRSESSQYWIVVGRILSRLIQSSGTSCMRIQWYWIFSRYLSSRVSRTYWFFFFQAEDGIRDGRVTGVQTCALPILDSGSAGQHEFHHVSRGTDPSHPDHRDVNGVSSFIHHT